MGIGGRGEIFTNFLGFDVVLHFSQNICAE
jgi:hypothetical protein